MYPHPISSQEAYGKHRRPEEIREIERQNQILETRSFIYGDPVNNKADYDEKSAKKCLSEKTSQQRSARQVPLLLRVFFFFMPFLGSR